MKIGFQGDYGSFSEMATKKYCKEKNLSDIVLLPLISSKMVVNELLLRHIDLGIMAISNNHCGTVLETKNAVFDAKGNLRLINLIEQEICHCLFKKRGIKISDNVKIYSHEQALRQCEQTLKNKYPNCILCEIEDTAIAAKYLSLGIIEENSMVICPKNAGDLYGLECILSNVQDNKNNITKFGVFKLK